MDTHESDPGGAYVADEDMDAPIVCELCGEDMEWEDCDACGGDGYFDWDTLQFDDPLWYQPGDTKRCDQCDGAGGWRYCPRAPHGS